MENTNPNAAGEAAIAPVTPAKKRQAKKLAIIPMLDGYTPIAANTRRKTVLTTAYDFAADYPFPCRNNRRAHFEDGERHRLHRTPWFHISDCRFFLAPYTGVGFFRLVIKILRGAAFGVTELRANLLLAFTLARADGEVFFKVGYYIVALLGR